MKFSCPLIFGLMFSCICFTGSSEKLTVNQSPSKLTVSEGDSANISCCWNKTHGHKVSWYINETKHSGVKDKLQEHHTQNCSTLHLTNILKNHTGHYVCEVTQDIPALLEVNGTGTYLSVSVRQLQKTTTDNVHIVSNPPTMVQVEVPTRLPAASSSREVVIIYILRSLPIICLLMTFFYLNRDDKQATVSKPESEEGLDEDLKAEETQRNQTELSEQEKGRDNSEKPEVTAAETEEEKNEEKETVVVVDVEQGLSALHGNENKTVSVLDISEKTNLMADVEDVTVSVLDGIVSAL
ncbi:hypothetical protein R3I93_014357 [Phoxinus phoxinus]|uniref:Ig-like domain-containing protein n=1 Tax=Phoxinus phoxinus TaxID=58324 RepID=A0AAN9CMZ9_9TELE